MIEALHLTKRYRDLVAVDDLTFSVEPGQILGFLGPNGAGKSTTMRMITGYMPSTEGTVKVDGFDVFESPLEVKRRIGYLPEQPPVYADLTAREYLRFVASVKGVPRKQFASEIASAAERTGIADVLPAAHRQPLQGLQAARGPGPGPPRLAQGPHPRRAHRGPRPLADHRGPRADQVAGRATTR